MPYEEREIRIGEIEGFLKAGYRIEVDSPDGYIPVTDFVDKGMWDEYLLKLSDGRIVSVNENHLFETDLGWQYTKDLQNLLDVNFLCDSGWESGNVTKTNRKIPIVDIQVNHDNHRYYTNGISSHNTGVGKTLFMCHVAASTLMQGKNVLYVTMEMSEEQIAERIDTNLLNMTTRELESLDKPTYDSRMARLLKKNHGHLIVKEYPEYGAHAGTIRALIDEIKIKKNITIDLLVIDYLNICASSRLKVDNNSYAYIKSIASEVRGLGKIFDMSVLSATQTTRGGYDNSDVGLTDTSESFGLPATADLMFAIISTEELEALGHLMIKQLKNRKNDVNYYKRFVIGVDRTKMRLYDVEDSAQKNIADSGQGKGSIMSGPIGPKAKGNIDGSEFMF